MRPRLTYANVVATLALFLALGGASYAALTLPRNSVGTTQLKAGSVTLGKLAFPLGAATGTQQQTETVGTIQACPPGVTLCAVPPEGVHVLTSVTLDLRTRAAVLLLGSAEISEVPGRGKLKKVSWDR